MNAWVVIPVKPLGEGKSRLTSVLAPAQRSALSQRILQRELDLVLAHELVAGVAVISRDQALLDEVAAQGAVPLHEIQPGLVRHVHRRLDRDDANLLSVFADQPDFGRVDLPVNALLLFLSDGSVLHEFQKNQIEPARASTSRCQRSISSSRVIWPRSWPPRARTATSCASFSLSPTTSW